MRLDLQTLAFVLGLTILAQVVALAIQYHMNREYAGPGWWLLGSLLTALGFISLTLGAVPVIGLLSRIGNPLLVLGRVALLIGILRFFDRREGRWTLGALFVSFLAAYYHYLLVRPDLALRTALVTGTISVVSLLAALELLFRHRKSVVASSIFTGSVFLAQGGYSLFTSLYTLFSKPVHSYAEYSLVQVGVFIVPTLTSTLWTFGFILMVNQQLNAENTEEKENLRQVFNTAPDAALITCLSDGRIVDANSGFCQMSGHARQEVLGTRIQDLNFWRAPEDRSRFLSELMANRGCDNLEFPFRCKDGRFLLCLISARLITIHGEPHVLSVTRDITERKRAEDALRESEETYRSILKASPDDITITDLEGRILMVSPAAYTLFGYQPGEELGRQLLDFAVPEDRERARANIAQLLGGGQPRPSEYQGLRKDGSLVDMEVNSGLINGAHGQPVKMVFVVRDISERKRAEAERAELESRNRQLVKAESLGRMAGAIAHHFNNQLQSVLGNLELARQAPKEQDPSRWLVGAQRATERAAEVSRLMLAYLGQASQEREPRFLAELCRDTVRFLQDTLPPGVALEADLPAPGPVVCMDSSQFQQLLANLVTNAWEALEGSRGLIHLRVAQVDAGDIPAGHRFPVDWRATEPAYACLDVADEGGGIPSADLEKLFDPFFSTKFTGRGLGLSVVLGIVQSHGGVVTVESRQGKGSRFRIHIPVCPEAAHARGSSDAPHSTMAAGGTLLLVDDDEDLLETTGEVLELLGLTALKARNGIEALEVFERRRNEIRCVITDLTMPLMDGWETLTALHRLDPDLPVILASGYDRAQVMAGTHPVQPRRFLGKPFSLQALREALDQVLEPA